MSAPLDDVLPIYQHRERHSTTVVASPAEVWVALLTVSVRELRLSRTLMALRTFPSRLDHKGQSLASTRHQSFVNAFLKGGFRKLRVQPPFLLVAGAAGQPWRLHGGEFADVGDLEGFRAFMRPGFVLMATSFELDAERDGAVTRLSTETRVQPTDRRSGRAFWPYWWAIRAGSGLVRRDVLGAVRRRAERSVR